MPGMTGLDLAMKIKQIHPRMPIIIATGYAELPPHVTLDFPRLNKPYTQQQLAEVIETASRLSPRSLEQPLACFDLSLLKNLSGLGIGFPMRS